MARKLLGISLSPSQTASSVSVIDVAGVTEKPGVQTRSRKAEFEDVEYDDEKDVIEETEKDHHGEKKIPAATGCE